MMKRKIMTKQTWNIPPDKRVRVSMTRQNRKAENGEKVAGRHAGGESRFPASGRKRSPFPHLQKIRLLPGRRHTTSENTIMKFFSAACILGICCLLSGAQKSAENSSTLFDPPKQHFLETGNNMLSNPTAYAGSVSLKQKNIGNFKMAFQLRLLPLKHAERGAFSVTIGRGYGTWRVSFSPGMVASQFISTFPVKKSKPLFQETFRADIPENQWNQLIFEGNDKIFALSINGKRRILGTAPGAGAITFSSHRQAFTLHNLKLECTPYRLPLSANLLLNSSFEYATNPGMPDSWGGGGRRYRVNGMETGFCTEKGRREFHKCFFHDGKESFHGEKSLSLRSPLHVIAQPVRTGKNGKYTLSLFLKGNDAEKVEFGVTADSIERPLHRTVAAASREWQRVETTFDSRGASSLSVFVRPLGPSPVFLDAVQLEAGTKSTPYRPCWLDGGYELPNDVNIDQCAANVNSIARHTARKETGNSALKISSLALQCTDPLKSLFHLQFRLSNTAEEEKTFHLSAAVSDKNGIAGIHSGVQKLNGGEQRDVAFGPMKLSGRKAEALLAANRTDGTREIFIREQLELPLPVKIYTEYPHYTTEDKNIRLIAEFDSGFLRKTGKAAVELALVVPDDARHPLSVRRYPLSGERRQIFPMETRTLRAEDRRLALRLNIVGTDRKILCSATAPFRLKKTSGPGTGIRINRISRTLYRNGKPFFPCGVLVFLPFGKEQLAYYKQCGFEDIMFVSHWSPETAGEKFIADCEELGLTVWAYHLSRKNAPDPEQTVRKYRKYSNFAGMIPNDESSDPSVRLVADAVKAAAPEKAVWINHNFFTYRAFAEKNAEMPGDVISIDRYPFILQPPGRPQPTRDIFSLEQCLQMMKRDGERERKPVFLWLQSGERFAKEPTPEELTYQFYLGLIRKAAGFCYFGGFPCAETVWKRMRELNAELRELKEELFSPEDDPENVISESKDIVFLAKQRAGILTVMALNRTPRNVRASLRGLPAGKNAEVKFENRTLAVGTDGVLTDEFPPLARHVYQIKLK